ncbi:hypothetical protein ABCS02_33560 [Microbacterium sp. X-17]|uniref:hypothetical protein n=1 Tax=Microbacterium sp. X-17 TaxID=3144404 RepID=UPI0031F581F3
MNIGWFPAAAGAILALASAAYYVSSIVRESGKLRRIERVNDIISKLEPDSSSRDGLINHRDRLITSYLAIKTDTRKSATRLAAFSGGFYVGGFLCYLASFAFGFGTPSGQAWAWAGAALLLIGVVFISRAERRLVPAAKTTTK